MAPQKYEVADRIIIRASRFARFIACKMLANPKAVKNEATETVMRKACEIIGQQFDVAEMMLQEQADKIPPLVEPDTHDWFYLPRKARKVNSDFNKPR